MLSCVFNGRPQKWYRFTACTSDSIRDKGTEGMVLRLMEFTHRLCCHVDMLIAVTVLNVARFLVYLRPDNGHNVNARLFRA